jgi:hypothetical protein
MQRWRQWSKTGKLQLANLNDDEVRAIKVTALVMPGNPDDERHPGNADGELHGLLPNAVWADRTDPQSKETLRRLKEPGWPPTTAAAFKAPIYENRLRCIESGEFVPDKCIRIRNHIPTSL